MLRTRRFWVGFFVSLLFLALFLYQVDLREMVRVLGNANYLLAIPAALVYLAAMVLRGFRWRYLLRPLATVPLGRLFPVLVIGYTANNLLPMRLGELVRAYYLGEREGISKTAAFATIVVERVFDGLTLLFFVALVSMFTPVLGLLQGLGESSGIPWVVIAFGLSLPFGVAMTLLVATAYASPVLDRLLVLGLMPSKIRELLELFIQGLGALRGLNRLASIFLLSVPLWLVDGLAYLLMAHAFGLDSVLSPLGSLIPALLLVMSISNLATALPSSQGGVGPFEFFAKTTLVLLGVQGATASAYALAVHLVLIVPLTLLGLGYLWWLNLSVAQLAGTPGKMGTRELSLRQRET